MSYTRYTRNFIDTMPFSNTCVDMQLVATTALSYTVPGTSKQLFRASFRCDTGETVWVALNGTAVLPTSGVATAVSNQEFIPLFEPKFVKGGDTLSFISPGTPHVGVSFLLLQDTTGM